MNLQVVGCSHHAHRDRRPRAAGLRAGPGRRGPAAVAKFVPRRRGRAAFHLQPRGGLCGQPGGSRAGRGRDRRLPGPLPPARPGEIVPHLYVNTDEAAVRHLFSVAASLDSMVLGEPQILAQVKQAYQAATEREATGPLLHQAFQAAIRVARRVASETAIHQRRVSIPSVAVADFARQIFERFDDKETLVIGAGEMAEETLRYLRDEGARSITVVNRSFERACERAAEWNGTAPALGRTGRGPGRRRPGDQHHRGRTGRRPAESFRRSTPPAATRPLFMLDLAVPRDFEPAVGDFPRSTSIRSTTCRRPAGTIARSATGKFPPPSGSSSRRPAASWARCITAPPGR